ALSVEQVAPPAHVRQRLLTRAHLTPTQPETQPPAPAPQPAARTAGWASAQRLSGLVAAASLVIAVATGGYAVAAQRQLLDARGKADYAMAQLSDTLSIVYQPNLVARPLSGMEAAPQATGKVLMAPDRNKAVVIAYGVPQIKPDQSLQCWMTTQDDKRVDGGTFRPDSNGKAYWVVRLPEMLAKYRWMGVTIEAGKGAPQPQGPRVLGGNL
ncbi:MAG TPA: anti-sigma factor, partial [Chloroflexota bacterium]|nr:anti-sigma factor [Chloroflexota bacterium]